jgi:hypothetical protein
VDRRRGHLSFSSWASLRELVGDRLAERRALARFGRGRADARALRLEPHQDRGPRRRHAADPLQVQVGALVPEQALGASLVLEGGHLLLVLLGQLHRLVAQAAKPR